MWSGSGGNGRWKWLLVFLGVGSMAYLMVQDLYSLGETVLRVGAKKIPMTVENVVISRTFSGDHWLIQAPLLEKSSGEVRGASLDIRVRFAENNGGMLLRAEKGVFREDGGELHFWVLEGKASLDLQEGIFEAPEVLWSSVSDEAYFPQGLRLSFDGATLWGREGTLRRDGSVHLGGKVGGEWPLNE